MPSRTSADDLRRPEIQQLRVFVALNDRGSITAASRALGLAQSTVSEALASLERSLGATLIVRRHGSRRVLLTEAGRALLPHARAVLDALEAGRAAVARATATAHATVEIIANESISTYVLPSVLAPVRLQWPNTRFAVTVATCAQVRQAVLDGDFDLGLMLEAACTRTAAIIDAVPLVVFMTPQHPLANGNGPTMARRSALADYAVFLSDAAGDFHTLVYRFFKGDGVPAPRLEATGTVEGVKRAVLADDRAFGVLPAYAIDAELRQGLFVRLDLHPALPLMQLKALLSSSRASHPATLELLNAIRRCFSTRIGPARTPRKIS